jgi:hypothetical protein
MSNYFFSNINYLLTHSYSKLIVNSSLKYNYTQQANLLSKAKNNSKLMSSHLMNQRVNTQIYDYILVLDFEATCDDKKTPVPQVTSYFD